MNSDIENKRMMDHYVDEFSSLLKKYNIDEVILCNNDDGKMGYYQLMKILDIEGKRILSMKFSGRNEALCPCCGGKDRDE